MSIPINHRFATVEQLTNTNNLKGISLAKLMMSTDQQSLGEAATTVFFYEVVPGFDVMETRGSKARTGLIPASGSIMDVTSREHPITSTCQSNFIKYGKYGKQNGPTLKKYGVLKFPNLHYKLPSEETFLCVMKLFKKHTACFDYKIQGNNHTSSFFDWRPLFNGECMPDGSSLDNLQEIC